MSRTGGGNGQDRPLTTKLSPQPGRTRYTGDMTWRRLAIAAVLAVCLGGPVIEMFDDWDHTYQDGNDTETNVVVVALCVGVALAVAGRLLAHLRMNPLRAVSGQLLFSPAAVIWLLLSRPLFSGSPPTPLRV